MHVHPRHRRVPPAISVLWVAALLAICCSGTAIAAVSSKPKPKPKPHHVPLGGSWSGQYSGAFSGTFTLHWKLSKGHPERIDHAHEAERNVHRRRQR